tara:strand:- start:4445 stop:4951 length:507 start_codon:yes stop_codon:yes gene_type:complete
MAAQSQDQIFESNTKFIHRFDDITNELTNQIKSFFNVFSPNIDNNDYLQIQRKILNINDSFNSTQELVTLIKSKIASYRTDCTLENLEDSIAFIINQDFEIIDNRETKLLTLKIYGEPLSDFQRNFLAKYLPKPLSASWFIEEERVTGKYGKSTYGVINYIEPVITTE